MENFNHLESIDKLRSKNRTLKCNSYVAITALLWKKHLHLRKYWQQIIEIFLPSTLLHTQLKTVVCVIDVEIQRKLYY